jgi:hypothetical protein
MAIRLTPPRGSFATCAMLATFSAVLAFACNEPAKPAASPVAPGPSDAGPPAVDAAPAAATLPPDVPDSPAGHQLAWVLASLARAPSEAEVAPHFTTEFAAQVPPANIVSAFAQFASQLPSITVDHVQPGHTPERLVVVVSSEKPGSDGGAAVKMRIALAVEEAEPHKIVGLTFRPLVGGPDVKPAASWDEVQAGLRAVAPSVGFLAAEVVGNKCVAVSSIEPKKPLAVGSTFKLYVLEALAKQIAAGKHKWDDPIAIEEAKKSLPPGETRNESAGKTFTVRELAEKMISVSDNTATDHLLAFVGRGAVEEAVKSSGNATPAREVPFLSTRDMFALKLLGSPEELKGYVAVDVPHKRKLLESFELRDLATPAADPHGWSKPRMIDSIEWFASPEDLCKLMVALKARADAPATAPVGAILALNPGIPDESGGYKYIAFKGGSEPGVLNLTWLLQKKSDDKWVFLTAGFNDPSAAVDEAKAVGAASAARTFFAK